MLEAVVESQEQIIVAAEELNQANDSSRSTAQALDNSTRRHQAADGPMGA